MSFFDAPGWDNGNTPVASSSIKRSAKRKRGSPWLIGDDESTLAPADTSSLATNAHTNLQKLLRKMRLEQKRGSGEEGKSEPPRRSSAKEVIRPAGSVVESVKRKEKNPPARLDLSASPRSTTLSVSSPSDTNNYGSIGIGAPPSKKPRIRREDSDILPPSSAGDETEPVKFISALKKKRKKAGKKNITAPTQANGIASSELALMESDDDAGTPRPGAGALPVQSSWPTAIGESSSSSEFAGLTKLQREMKQRLSGGRFRMINELLYKSESAHAHELMRKDPAVFNEYHTGFRNQVQSWPKNPVAYYTEFLLSVYSPASTFIVDLGCGDAALAKALVPKGFRVLSYDLVSDGEWVTDVDICDKLPLPGREDGAGAQIVDICVCALSLMNTNWIRCVREARRILKADGVFEIAEVTSRFTDVKAFITVVCSVGFELVTKSEPSTHFRLFTFRKVPRSRPMTPKEWEGIQSKAQGVLSPCEYKRR